MTFGLKLRETPLYGTKRYVETRVDAVAKKKCSNPNLFEKNISSRLSRKPFFNFFAREHQQQKLSELQFTGFNDFNDPTINFASRTFFASLKSFFAAGHFFLGCPHTTRFIETRFLQWADFFLRGSNEKSLSSYKVGYFSLGLRKFQRHK